MTSTQAKRIHDLAVQTDTRLAELWETADRNTMFARNELAKRDRDNGRWFSEEAYDAYVLRAAQAQAEAAPYEALYAEHGWSRFFLVKNTNGHIHSSMSCTTCYRDTQYAWLPSLSGLTEADAVEAMGEILCSVCFPSAPVEWTTGEAKATKDAKAERAAKKAERDAKRIAKALFPDDPDRGLQVPGDTLRTIASAKAWLTAAAGWDQSYAAGDFLTNQEHHPSFPPEAVAAVAQALADREGTTPEAVLEAAAKRAKKRGY